MLVCSMHSHLREANLEYLTASPPSSTVPSRVPSPAVAASPPKNPPHDDNTTLSSDTFVSTLPLSPPGSLPQLTLWPPRRSIPTLQQNFSAQSNLTQMSPHVSGNGLPFNGALAQMPGALSQPPLQVPRSPNVTTQLPDGPSVGPSALPEALPDPALSTRGRRLRKANLLSLNTCTCGITITEAEITTGTDVMRCRVQGCETVWVRSHFRVYHPMCLPLALALTSTIDHAWITSLCPRTGSVIAAQPVLGVAVAACKP